MDLLLNTSEGLDSLNPTDLNSFLLEDTDWPLFFTEACMHVIVSVEMEMPLFL